MKVQEWIQAACDWLGVTDPMSASVVGGGIVGFVIATLLAVAVRLTLFVLSCAVGSRCHETACGAAYFPANTPASMLA